MCKWSSGPALQSSYNGSGKSPVGQENLEYRGAQWGKLDPDLGLTREFKRDSEQGGVLKVPRYSLHGY